MKNEKSDESRITVIVVLKELFELLEEYAPAWYGEEQHYRALLALRHEEPRKKKKD